MLSHSSPVAATAAGFGVPTDTDLASVADWGLVLSPDPVEAGLNWPGFPQSAQRIQRGFCPWLVLGFAGSCLSSTVALVAYTSLVQVSPADMDCDAALLSGRQRLSCAQQVASSGEAGDAVAALQLTQHWSVKHPLYNEAQPLLSRWSATVLRSAQAKYDQQGQAEARWLVAQIPPHSPDYDAARQLLNDWQQEYHREGMALYGQAQRALQTQDWAGAIQAAQRLARLEAGHPELNWATQLSDQIQAERHAQHQLSTGLQLATADTTAGLEAAVNHLSQIDPHTYVWQAAQPFLNRWSDRLLAQALSHWYAGELHAAIHLGEQVLANPDRAQTAQDLIWLSQSRQLALKSLEASPTTLAQKVGVYPALLVAAQITPESPFHPQAAAMTPTWQRHLGESRFAKGFAI